MARRTLRAGRFALTLEVPSGMRSALLRRLRLRATPARPEQPLHWLPRPPALRLEVRDPVGAVAPWRRPAVTTVLPNDDAPLEEQVRARSWYHTLELPGGIVTPGEFDHRSLVAGYGLPADLTGRSALDVATFDGFWAFELERRGATVTAIDVGRISDYDYPTAARQQLEAEQLDRPHVTGFELARRALGSSVRRVTANVYDLNPSDHGVHDFVHAADLLLHLESPIRALRAIRSVTGHTAHIVDAYDPDVVEDGSQMVRYLGGWHVITWWLPSASSLAQMVLDAGFRTVRVHAAYTLGWASGGSGLHRAVLVAGV